MLDFLGDRLAACPKLTGDDVGRRMELALACMRCVKPNLAAEEASKALHRAFLLEHPENRTSLPVPIDVLQSVTTPTEARKMGEYEDTLKRKAAEQVLHTAQRRTRVEAYFKPAAKARASASAARKRAAAPRWLPKANPRSSEVTKWLERHGPDHVSFVCDDYNGRWRVISEAGVWKSVSWTKRGFEVGAAVALGHAWRFEEEYTGAVPPFDLETLVADVEFE